MQAYFKGQPMVGVPGPAGPDGNPIGTIISYMGYTAPTDYLVCDGTEYDILQYPQLAKFFEAQFGSADHFGGDGETTFAVPDMRNLFLRGFHGDSEEQLSGEIGMTQDGTEHYGFMTNTPKTAIMIYKPSGPCDVINPDTQTSPSIKVSSVNVSSESSSSNTTTHYTSRPINMAVLYCIKAIDARQLSNDCDDVYSIDEMEIGTWIDGNPLYRRVYTCVISANQWTTISNDIPPIEFAKIYASAFISPTYYTIPVATSDGKAFYVLNISNKNFSIYNDIPAFVGKRVWLIVEYTKTTDPIEFEWWSPKMTSDTTPAPFVASSTKVLNSHAYYAFDGIVNDSDLDRMFHTANEANVWVSIDMGEPTAIFGLCLIPSAQTPSNHHLGIPKQFVLYGSNDNSSWEQVFINDPNTETVPIPLEHREYVFDEVSYRYYKIKPNGGNWNNEGYFVCADILFLRLKSEVVTE